MHFVEPLTENATDASGATAYFGLRPRLGSGRGVPRGSSARWKASHARFRKRSLGRRSSHASVDLCLRRDQFTPIGQRPGAPFGYVCRGATRHELCSTLAEGGEVAAGISAVLGVAANIVSRESFSPASSEPALERLAALASPQLSAMFVRWSGRPARARSSAPASRLARERMAAEHLRAAPKRESARTS